MTHGDQLLLVGQRFFFFFFSFSFSFIAPKKFSRYLVVVVVVVSRTLHNKTVIDLWSECRIGNISGDLLRRP
jgi:hypothetical protein